MADSLEVLTVAQMAMADAFTIKSGLAGIRLMEAAGKAVADEVTRRWSRRPVVVLCGPGNNGGDGFVAARHLSEAGWPVEIALLGRRDKLAGDAAMAAAAWPGDVQAMHPEALSDGALVIDGLFGAGLVRPIEGAAKTAIEAINHRRMPCVAIDLPSGVHGDTGLVLGVAPKCLLTVTFFRRKLGHLLMPGRRHVGEVVTADIGIPDRAIGEISSQYMENQPAAWLGEFPTPAWDDHKHRRGHVLISGGPVMTGATRLAAAGARRGGAGLVTVACSPESHGIYATDAPGLITAIADSDEAFDELLTDKRRNVMLIGPGHGLNESTRLRTLAGLKSGKKCVIDADALAVFSGRPADLFDEIAAPCILTPHEGEFAKLFPDLAALNGKVNRAVQAARRSRAVILLKGPDTVIAGPDGRAFVNGNAPPTLATAGTGDVLAGLAAAYLAQGIEPLKAAAIAVWIHGAAATAFGAGLLAEDLLDGIQKILNYINTLQLKSNEFSE